ncbi:MAG: hypothetical protein WC712_09265 [Candidatus Brocadiia bacterium]
MKHHLFAFGLSVHMLLLFVLLTTLAPAGQPPYYQMVQDDPTINGMASFPVLVVTGVTPPAATNGNSARTATILEFSPNQDVVVILQVQNLDQSSIPATSTITATWTATGPAVTAMGSSAAPFSVLVRNAQPPQHNYQPVGSSQSPDGFLTLAANGLTATLTLRYGNLLGGNPPFPAGAKVTVQVTLTCLDTFAPLPQPWVFDPQTESNTYSTMYSLELAATGTLPNVGDFSIVLEPPGGLFLTRWMTRAKIKYNSGDGYSESLPSGGTLTITATPSASVVINGDTASCLFNGINTSYVVTATGTFQGTTRTATGTFTFTNFVGGGPNTPPWQVTAGISILNNWARPCVVAGAESVSYYYDSNVPYPRCCSPEYPLGDGANTRVRFVATGYTVVFSRSGIAFPDVPVAVYPGDAATVGATIAAPSMTLSDLKSTSIAAKLTYSKQWRDDYNPTWQTYPNGNGEISATASDTALRYYTSSTYKCACGLKSAKTGIKYICDHNNTKNRGSQSPDDSVKCDYVTSGEDSNEGFQVEWSVLPSGIHTELVNVTSEPDQPDFAHRIFPDHCTPEWDTHFHSKVMGCHPTATASGGFKFRLFSSQIDEISSTCAETALRVTRIDASVDEETSIFSYSLNEGSEKDVWTPECNWSDTKEGKVIFIEMSPSTYGYLDEEAGTMLSDPREQLIPDELKGGLSFCEVLLSVDFPQALVEDYFRESDKLTSTPQLESTFLSAEQTLDDVYPRKTADWYCEWTCTSYPEGATPRFVCRKTTGENAWAYLELSGEQLQGRSKTIFYADRPGHYTFSCKVHHAGASQPEFTDRIDVCFVRCDLIGDYNRNGIIDKKADDPGGDREAQPVVYFQTGNAKQKGIVVLVNRDDDDLNTVLDCDDSGRTAPTVENKEDDLAPLRIGSNTVKAADIEKVTFILSKPTTDQWPAEPHKRLRLLVQTQTEFSEVIGPGSISDTVEITSRTGIDKIFSKDSRFWLEGLEHGTPVILTMKEKDKGKAEVSDSIAILVCPFIALSSSQGVFGNLSTSIVVPSGAALHDAVSEAYGNPSEPSQQGIFPRDSFMAGCQYALSCNPEQTAPTANDRPVTLCLRKVGGKPEITRLGMNYFEYTPPSAIVDLEDPGPLNLGGALEVLPSTAEKPFGILLLTKYEGQSSALKPFFVLQVVQFPTEIDMSGLPVRHIDEVVCVFPAIGEQEPKILIADMSLDANHPNGGLRLLKQWLTDNDEATPGPATAYPLEFADSAKVNPTYGDVYSTYVEVIDGVDIVNSSHTAMVNALTSISGLSVFSSYTVIRAPVLFAAPYHSLKDDKNYRSKSENICNSLVVKMDTSYRLFAPHLGLPGDIKSVFGLYNKNIVLCLDAGHFTEVSCKEGFQSTAGTSSGGQLHCLSNSWRVPLDFVSIFGE